MGRLIKDRLCSQISQSAIPYILYGIGMVLNIRKNGVVQFRMVLQKSFQIGPKLKWADTDMCTSSSAAAKILAFFTFWLLLLSVLAFSWSQIWLVVQGMTETIPSYKPNIHVTSNSAQPSTNMDSSCQLIFFYQGLTISTNGFKQGLSLVQLEFTIIYPFVFLAQCRSLMSIV